MRRSAAFASVTMTAVLALTACGGGGGAGPGSGGGPGGPSGTAAKGGTVHFLSNADFSHLDPARGWDGGVNNFYRLIYRGLTTVGAGPGAESTKVVPDLATDTGKPSADHKTWTYTLKDGIFFEDGTPITSEAVKFGFSRSFDPEAGIGSPYAKLLLEAPKDYKGPYLSGDLNTIETPDDKTVVFHLKKSFPDFPSALTLPNFVPFPKGTGAAAAFDTKPIASGPYKVASYQHGSSLKLVRNPYWKPESDPVRAAKPDAWEWTFGVDEATIDERMLAGQGTDGDAIMGIIQSSTVARAQAPQVKSRSLSGLTGCTTYMSLNTTKKPLDDLRVRQAINYAVDKDTVVTAQGGSALSAKATAIQPPTIAGRVEYDPYPHNVETAKKLLAEAGLSGGFSLTLDARNDPKMQAIAVAIQEALKQVNIDLKIKVVDVSTFYEVIATPAQQNDAAVTGWCPDWASGATFLPPLFDGRTIVDKGNQNLAQINDKAINERIDEIAAMPDVEQANAAYGELDKQIMEQAPIVPLTYEKHFTIAGSNIAGAYLSDSFSGAIDLISVGLADPKK
ncbi:ABC transporter substrate-binding protein [Nonomuraea jiangxiensis]|uniref:Peptide/nickel transport system substrate-binding protein n=1 Tax=Nonomuraea jiangxiensis TaxID=633440 RepID=A0A1G9DKN1_9ACTN|nr:ABC transporter substrate-binding protein [Nonomuraea jiangxiensis]SDK64409.1 peptide/nickel transport system substrate-binding protein [Nonomuraea jiangxiensis]